MEDVNSAVARMNLRALLRVPLPLLSRLKGAGVLIFISARPVPENADLGIDAGREGRGATVPRRGIRSKGPTFPTGSTSSPGGCPGMDASSGSSLPHELGHAVAHALGYLSSRALIEAHERVFGHLPAYERQGGPGAEAGRDATYAEIRSAFRSRALAERPSGVTDADASVKWLEASLVLARSLLARP